MQGRQYMQMLDEKLAASGKARYSASKYDFVKVKVWVGENLAHYYVLSRFLISRMLTVTKIPQMKAVKIALEVKKHLVDNDFMDISQDHFEAILFSVMRDRGFGDDYVERYKMVTKFFQQRRPLIVLLCGVPCTGKSTLAQQLASRLNMPNVLQTDAIYELMRMSEDGPLQPTPLWDRDDLNPGGLVREFLRECRIVRKGLDGSLFKCIGDGKSIIMEGMHLDPSLYLYEFARFGQAHLKNAALTTGDSVPAGVSELPSPGEEESTSKTESKESDQEVLRVSGRAVSADEQLLSDRGGRRLRLPARRSASFMLLPSQALGHMSPVLAHAAELHSHASPAMQRHPALHNSIEQPIMQRHHRSGDEATASNAFLSMSPTMQWLQVAFSTGNKDLRDSSTEIAQHTSTTGPSVQLGGKPPLHSPRRGALSEQMPLPRLPEAACEQQPDHLASAPASDACTEADLMTENTDSAGHAAMGTDSKQVGSSNMDVSTIQEAGREGADEHSQVKPSGKGRQGTGAHGSAAGSAGATGAAATQQTLEGKTGEGMQQGRGPGGPGTNSSRRGAAASAVHPEEDLKPGPVFVPIVLCMDDADHELLVREWHACYAGPVRDGEALGGAEERARSTLERLRVLQSHLCSYVQRSVPVVKVELANFNETLDRLHDYLLLCIQMAMEQDKADAPSC
ncbi:probable 2-phosphoglycerate kinase at N-terminal half [Coccomyxa sp. Obi]|nr:probable 2-phosphoglycerate kinase at N-terminal half [Coccomyxa sp. Obi]